MGISQRSGVSTEYRIVKGLEVEVIEVERVV